MLCELRPGYSTTTNKKGVRHNYSQKDLGESDLISVETKVLSDRFSCDLLLPVIFMAYF